MLKTTVLFDKSDPYEIEQTASYEKETDFLTVSHGGDCLTMSRANWLSLCNLVVAEVISHGATVADRKPYSEAPSVERKADYFGTTNEEASAVQLLTVVACDHSDGTVTLFEPGEDWLTESPYVNAKRFLNSKYLETGTFDHFTALRAVCRVATHEEVKAYGVMLWNTAHRVSVKETQHKGLDGKPVYLDDSSGCIPSATYIPAAPNCGPNNG